MTECKPRISPPLAGACLAVLAAFLFSLLNVAIRLSEPHLTVWHMMFGRSVFGMAVLYALAKAGGVSLLGRKRRTLLLVGLSGTGGILCLTLALLRIPLFQALILFYTYPAVAALLSPLLTKDRIVVRDWACILLAFTGTVLILWSGQNRGISVNPGHLAAIGASAGLGLTLTLIRRVSPVNNSLTPIFYISALGTVICFFPLILAQGQLLVPPRGMGWLAAIGLLAVSAHVATNQALSHIPSPRVGIIGMLEVLLGALYGYLLFQENLEWSTLSGGVLIIGAAAGLIRSSA